MHTCVRTCLFYVARAFITYVVYCNVLIGLACLSQSSSQHVLGLLIVVVAFILNVVLHLYPGSSNQPSLMLCTRLNMCEGALWECEAIGLDPPIFVIDQYAASHHLGYWETNFCYGGQQNTIIVRVMSGHLTDAMFKGANTLCWKKKKVLSPTQEHKEMNNSICLLNVWSLLFPVARRSACINVRLFFDFSARFPYAFQVGLASTLNGYQMGLLLSGFMSYMSHLFLFGPFHSFLFWIYSGSQMS